MNRIIYTAFIIILLIFAYMFWTVYECGEVYCGTPVNSWSMA